MEASVLITAAVLLNIVGYIAWKRGELGQWYRAAVGAATLALLFGGGWVRALGSAWLSCSGFTPLWRGPAIVKVFGPGFTG